jgi:hypothetical protein
MNRNERYHLLAERTQLESVLATIPANQAITRSSFESRLHRVNEDLATAGTSTRLPVTTRLTFRGRPVIGSEAVFAEFGMAATQAFSEAVTARAASLKEPVSEMGPIPNRDDYQLLVTGTAVGSFGFLLEEPGDNLLFGEESPVGKALRQTQQLFESTNGSDDDLTEATAALPARVIKEARKFLETLAAHDAVCNIAVGGHTFGFSDVGQVRRAVDRLDVRNIHQDDQSFFGSFLGVLPTARTFEFQVTSESNSVLRGKIASEVPDPTVINAHLNRAIQLTLTATRVGEGKPKYVLHQLPKWPASA